MSSGATVQLAKTGTIIDLALIAVAIPFIFLPEIRIQPMKAAVWAAFMLQTGLSTYISWKAGMLTKTLGQIYEGIQKSGPATRRRFERIAFFLGLVAVILATWS